MPPTSTMSDHGTRGAKCEPPKSTASEMRPTTRVSPWKLAGVAQQHGDPLEDAAGGGGEPGQRGDLADHDEHDQARHETGDDRLAEELGDPAQAEQADGASTTPAVMASTEVSCTASSGLPPARARTIDPESTDTVEIGPTKSSREVPNSA